VKIGQCYADISASYGINVAEVMKSKTFLELIDSLAKQEGFEALNIKILSAITKIREVNCDFIVTRPDLPVCETRKRTSDRLATLDINTVVRVVEMHEEDEDGRVRARIDSPVAGWISISHHGGTVYAKKREDVSDTTSIECAVDAKIHGKFVPGILFMRGGAIAILVAIHVGEEKRGYTLLVQQDQVPNSLSAISEIPSGSLASDGKLEGAVFKDIREKLGLAVTKNDLVDVTEATYKEGTVNYLRFCNGITSMFPSCGSEKFDSVFVLQQRISKESFEKLKASVDDQKLGAVKLHLEPMQIAEGEQAHPAVGLYQTLIASGNISEPANRWTGQILNSFGKFLNSFTP
jgi:hypothetical protein